MAKSKKEKVAAPEKEHKKNWREVYASVEDIERYLSDHIQLRHNVIFMAPVQEFELVRMFFRKPEHKGEGDFTPVAAALQMISC